MTLEALIKVSFEKNMEAESPKKEYNKNNMKGTLIVLSFIKKNIKKTGTNKGFVEFNNKASSLKVPTMFRTIKRSKAPKNSLFILNSKRLFIIELHKIGYLNIEYQIL